MATFNSGSISFAVASGATSYPVRSTPDGTGTAGSSDFLSASGIILEGYVVEAEGSADGVLTISDHAGTAGTDINIDIQTNAASVVRATGAQFGPHGIAVPWTGIRAALTGTGQRVRVIFRSA